MRPIKILYVFILSIFSSLAVAQAAGGRDLIIQNELNCYDKHLPQDGGINWNDVCDMPVSSDQDHIQIVNQQMDQVQGISGQQTTPQQYAMLDNTQVASKKPEWVYAMSSEVSHISYHEPSLHVSEKGMMYGIDGSYTYRPHEGNVFNSEISNMYRLEGRFSYGKVDYNGSFSDGTPYTFDGISDYLFEFRGLLGKDFFINNGSTTLTPYLGGGYRSLFDTFSESPSGYNRRIQYLYIPTGFEVLTQLNDGWSIGGNLEYDFLAYGRVTSYLGELGLGDVSNNQKHGYGIRGSIKFIKKWDRINLIFEPFIRYWHIHNSDVQESTPFIYNGTQYVLVGLEPNNNSTEIGGKLGIEF